MSLLQLLNYGGQEYYSSERTEEDVKKLKNSYI